MALPPFNDPAHVARYAEGPPRQVPGFHDVHVMALVLLSERIAADGRLLVVGAGGGLELKALAAARAGWRFDGVDPSAEMLALAETTTAPWRERIALHLGTVDAAPDGPFDGALSLLTLHFIEAEERQRTLEAIRARLRPGAPLVVMHHSIDAEPSERAAWLSRYAAFAAEKGVDAAQAHRASTAIAERLPIASPAQDEAMLRAAGFRTVDLFYAAFTFRGWVAVA